MIWSRPDAERTGNALARWSYLLLDLLFDPIQLLPSQAIWRSAGGVADNTGEVVVLVDAGLQRAEIPLFLSFDGQPLLILASGCYSFIRNRQAAHLQFQQSADLINPKPAPVSTNDIFPGVLRYPLASRLQSLLSLHSPPSYDPQICTPMR